MEKKTQRKSKKVWIVLLTALLAVTAIMGGVFAKYGLGGIQDWGQMVAEKCYFTADLLGDTKMLKADGGSSDVYSFGPESTEGTWLLYGGVEHKLTINVQNYYDDERIYNSKGNALPATGGAGTVALIAVGAFLFLATATVLVTKKRMYNKG